MYIPPHTRFEGLKETPEDDRDFTLGGIYDQPELSSLDEYFNLRVPGGVRDQKSTDFCTAYATCAMSEVQEGIPLEPSFSFALGKKLSGNPGEWGQDIRSALKAHLQGALPADLSPYSLENHDDVFLRDFNNWINTYRERYGYILHHKKKTYFKVTGRYDHYDNIKTALTAFRSPVGIGIKWAYPFDTWKLDTIRDNSGIGHMVCVVGWNPNGLIIQNSFGTQAGKDGFHLVTREVINHFVERYGAYMFTDISREQAERLLQRTYRPSLFDRIKQLFGKLRYAP